VNTATVSATQRGVTLEDFRHTVYSTPLAELRPAQQALFQEDLMWPIFERLRAEDPVHFCAQSPDFGAYWSITRYDDVKEVNANHQVFSSESGITLADQTSAGPIPMFIAMDPPKHNVQRKIVNPAFSPSNIVRMEPLIRERAAQILDALPLGTRFDWVDQVSNELASMTLATLFGIPQEERHKLTYWCETVTANPGHSRVTSLEEKLMIMGQCHAYFMALWNERLKGEPRGDLISMLAQNPQTRNMEPMEYFGNVILLIVAGNDTTRNSITGSLLGLSQSPTEYQRLRENHGLVPNLVAESIRWQTPIAHMRRQALQDYAIGGKTIRKGDKVAMWYVSANRDERAFERPNDFRIDRREPRPHLSFGYGVHRCIGDRLAELQLRVLWEEILTRFPVIEVVEPPKRVYSVFVKGYEEMQVVIPGRR